MTIDRDDDVDELLRAAGADWRATEPPGLTAHRRVEPPASTASRWRRWLLPGLAAASVLALAVSVAVAARLLRTDPDHRPAATGLAALVVRDGDQVRATGGVYRSEHGLQLCGRIAVARTGNTRPTPAATDGPFDCGTQHIADLTGITDAHIATSVQVTGRWHDGSIAVHKLGVAQRTVGPVFVTPCPSPPGGWQPVDGMASSDIDPVATYVARHSEQFAALWVSREKGGPNYPNAEGSRSQLEIPTVGVVGDVTQARADLAAVYDGPLCVYPVDYAQADLHRGAVAVRAALGTRALQVSGNPVSDRVDVEINVLSPDDAAALGEVEGLLDVQPRIVPA